MFVFARRAAKGLLLLAALTIAPPLEAAPPTESPETPHGYGYLSARVFNFFVQRTIEEQTFMQETVLGATTQGSQSTKAQLTIRMLPSPAQGAFELCLAGQCRCDESESHKGPATIRGSSTTDFEARVKLALIDDEFRVEGVQAESQTQSQVHDVQTRNPLVERLAWRRANKKIPQVEQEVSRLAEEKVSARLREEVTKMAAQASRAVAEKAKQPLTEAGAWPRFQYATSETGLTFAAVPAGAARAIETSPPADWQASADMALCVHESLLEQMIDRLLGGKEVRDDQILRIVEMITGTAPRELWVHDRTDRWSVRLAAERPVELAFRDDAIHLTVNVKETIRGDERWSVPARVSASFKAHPHVDGLSLMRRGSLGVELSGSTEDSATEALHQFLTMKFGGVFAEEIHLDTLAPPTGGFGAKIRHVQPDTFRFENGWAHIVYFLHSAPPK